MAPLDEKKTDTRGELHGVCVAPENYVDRRSLKRRMAAARWNVSPRYLDSLKEKGEGPPYIKIGSRLVLYPIDTLDKWFLDRVVQPEAENESAT